MGARDEVVREVPPWSSLPTAKAWLLGYVRTDVPGYREFTIGGTLYVVASSTGLRFDDYVAAVNTARASTLTRSTTTGQVYSSETITVSDRLWWVCGMLPTAEPGGTCGTQARTVVPPAGIPLLGATWESVTSEVERRQIVDRHRRNQGFVWGSALVWRCSLTMHRWALQALQTGWCLRGKVTIGGASKLGTPVGLSDPDGAITGWVLGVEGVEWLDQTQTTARVTMSVVTT